MFAVILMIGPLVLLYLPSLSEDQSLPFYAHILILLIFIIVILLFLFTAITHYFTIVIDSQGVSAMFIKTIVSIPWSDIQEVGICFVPMGIVSETFVYFSRDKIIENLHQNVYHSYPTNDLIQLKYRPEAISAIKEFYDGEIRNLHDFENR
jgi:hypothetical protein